MFEQLVPETHLKAGETADWIFVVPNEARGWILDAICREIGGRVQGVWNVVYFSKEPLPPARNYFFAHYWNFMIQLGRQPEIMNSNTFVWYTHPREIPFAQKDIVEALNRTTRVIPTCSLWRDMLVKQGVRPQQLEVVLGAADPETFLPHARTGNGAVGLSSSFYDRKRPDLVLDLVRAMPHRRFLLVGRNWEKYQKFELLRSQPNFTYATVAYEQYPSLYAKMDVFLSASELEGGPIPLVEAMMCNVAPVASRTGFAPDIISQGENGYLFEPDAPAEVVAPLIDRAFDLQSDIRESVAGLSWSNFARTIIGMSFDSGGAGH